MRFVLVERGIGCTNPAPGLTPSDIGERFNWQAVLSELGFPLWASLGLVVRYTRWQYLDDRWHRFTRELGLGGWEAWGVVWLGCEGCACEDGG